MPINKVNYFVDITFILMNVISFDRTNETIARNFFIFLFALITLNNQNHMKQSNERDPRVLSFPKIIPWKLAVGRVYHLDHLLYILRFSEPATITADLFPTSAIPSINQSSI